MSTPIMKQYKAIKAENLDYLLFFRLGDFYELFFEDAQIAAKELNITLTKRAQKDEDIPMAGVPYHTSDYYIAKLVKAGYKIAICEQIGSELNSDKIINREVVQIITAGTLTHETMLESKRNNFLISIDISPLNVSLAIFDLSTNEFFIEDIESFELKNIIEKLDPSEILIQQQFAHKLIDIGVDRNKLSIVQPITKFHSENIILDFFKLHSNQSIHYLSIENKIVVATILEYVKHTQKRSCLNIKLPQKNIHTENVELDAFTRRNLEITKTLQNTKKGSLLSFIDQTKTAQGGRKIYKLLTTPVKNIETLNKRYDQIEFFKSQPDLLKNIQEKLKTLPDFERTLSKIIMRKASPFQIYQLAVGAFTLFDICNSVKIDLSFDNHFEILNDILKALDENAPNSQIPENYYIKKHYSQELDDWKAFSVDIFQQIEHLQSNYQQITKLSNLKIKLTPLGFLVEINNNFKEKLNYNFELKQALKTSSRYSTKDLDTINLKYSQSKEFIQQKEKEIFNNLCVKIESIAENIYEFSEISSNIDVYANLAFISNEYHHIRPVLTNENIFNIKGGKHPILDKELISKGKVFVSNDCNLDSNILFLTGPNMAGKSTYLRQQAIICLLAHCGMFVPCIQATIGIVDQIFSRISTNDDLMQGNSTFMVEMIEMALTMNQATSKSFLILDEVGRGTSSEEGEALAQSILEYTLNKLKARVIFATHYLSLGQLNHPQLEKKMMHIETNPLSFSYKIIDGVAEKSYALEVAKLAGMPAEIIENAYKILEKN